MGQADSVPIKTLSALAVGFFLLLAPQLERLPLWISAVAALSAGFAWLQHWRAWLALGAVWRWLLVLLAVTAFMVTHWGRFSVETAAAFFVLTVAFKWQEMTRRRDLFIQFFILCYLGAVTFLFEQDLFWSLLVLGAVLWMLHGLQWLNAERAPSGTLRDTGILLLKVAPLVALLFVFFPRLGPLWSVPLVSEQARTGLSDEITPGDISNLAQDDSRAFRVRFGGGIPPNRELYWRALILDRFDGRTWRQTGPQDPRGPGRVLRSEGIGPLAADAYEVLMEPSFQRWGFNLPNARALTGNIQVTGQDLVRFRRPVDTTVRYRLARGEAGADERLSPAARNFYTQLPAGSNPQTRRWVADRMGQGLTPRELVDTFAHKLRNEAYYYTLRPPLMQGSSVDQLLFQHKQGFCGHYASALAFVLRAAGVPARILTGYQGGDRGLDGDYLIVRQSHAHAWVEAHFRGQGWVRLDPTGWIAPSRIEQGLDAALGQGADERSADWANPSGLRDIPLYRWMRLRLDAMNYYWQQWVVGYQGETQRSLLDFLPGGADWATLGWWTAGLFGLVVLVVTAWVLWTSRPRTRAPEYRLYARWQRWLRRQGVSPHPGDTPLELARRASERLPDRAAEIARLARAFNRLFFGGARNGDLERTRSHLNKLVKSRHTQSR